MEKYQCSSESSVLKTDEVQMGFIKKKILPTRVPYYTHSQNDAVTKS